MGKHSNLVDVDESQRARQSSFSKLGRPKFQNQIIRSRFETNKSKSNNLSFFTPQPNQGEPSTPRSPDIISALSSIPRLPHYNPSSSTLEPKSETNLPPTSTRAPKTGTRPLVAVDNSRSRSRLFTSPFPLLPSPSHRPARSSRVKGDDSPGQQGKWSERYR